MSDDDDSGGGRKRSSWYASASSMLSDQYHSGRLCYAEITMPQVRENAQRTQMSQGDRERLEQVAVNRRAVAAAV